VVGAQHREIISVRWVAGFVLKLIGVGVAPPTEDATDGLIYAHLPHCRGPLIEIDLNGERLIGCVESGRPGRDKPSWRCRRTIF